MNEANSWKHTFKDLPKYDDNGKEITYTVKEEAIEGYESKIEGNAKDGFVITNKEIPKKPKLAKTGIGTSASISFTAFPIHFFSTGTSVFAKFLFVITNRNVEKTQVPVEKKWIGKVLKEIEVQLLANGKEIQNVKLNEGNSWKHTFKDLPVYDDNGKEITYTVKETKVEGYESKIEGNAKDGFVITNKEIPKKPRIPKTAVGTQIFGYVAMAGVSLGLLQISRKKRNK